MGLVQFLWTRSDSNAYETAEWNGKTIKVQVIADKRRERGNVGNLLADEGGVTLSTRNTEQYGINDVVKFRDKHYVITAIDDNNYDVAPQNTALVKAKMLQEIRLTLFQINSSTRNLHCATPIISVVDNVVTITCDTLDAVVYYSLDGYVPSSLSPKYSQPFNIGTADKVYALALKDGRLPSKIGVWSK